MLYSVQDIGDMISDGGLDYALLEGVDPERIEDPTLADMWTRAGDLLREIMEHTEQTW